jgi:hypothetical protein
MAQQRRFSSFSEIAAAMFPTLSPKAKEAAEQKQQAWRDQSKQSLLRGLRELNESLRADREKERR